MEEQDKIVNPEIDATEADQGTMAFEAQDVEITQASTDTPATDSAQDATATEDVQESTATDPTPDATVYDAPATDSAPDTPAYDATVITTPAETMVSTPAETVVSTPAETVILASGAGEEQTRLMCPPRHMRESLASLPTFDDVPVEGDAQDVSGAQTVVVTHAPVLTDDSAIAPTDEEQALSSLVTLPQDFSVDGTQTTPDVSVADALAPEPITSGVQGYDPSITFAAQNAEDEGKKTRKRVFIGLIGGLGFLTVVYVAVSLYFTSHFLPNTTVNGNDVSGMAVTDLAVYVRSIGENYSAHVTGDGLDITIPGSDISFVYDGDAYSKQAANQIDPWRWPAQLNQSHEYVVNEAISFDEAKLTQIVGGAVDKANEGATQPTNANMAYDGATSKFVVVADALGTAINKDAVISMVAQGVNTLQTDIALGDAELVQPTIKKDNQKLHTSIDTVNSMLDRSVLLRIADRDATTIDRNLLASWFHLEGDSDIAVNQDAIKEWAQTTLSDQFDSVGTKRSYTRPDGKQIEVEGGDPTYDYGWCLDGEELSNILADHLRNNNTDTIDVPMKRTAATWNPGGQDWPARYIDVDLSEQHVRMYDENSNVIWESDCVSGNPIYGGGTDTGVFFIYEKDSPMELVGLDYDGNGEPDYRSWVTYWMPFDGGEGLHDMSSRGAFGGNIYTYNGSHGCVNLPYSAAQALYGITQVGDPVIVHW